MDFRASMVRSLDLSRKAVDRLVSIPQVFWRYGPLRTAHDNRYIFHHIPKCAGTSAVDSMRQWFRVRTDYPEGWADEDNPVAYRKFVDSPYRIADFRHHELLAGHFHTEGSFLDQRYPQWQALQFKIFTFLRDPLELRVSLYKYEIKNKRYTSDEPIEKQILSKPNYIAGRIPCTEANYASVLSRYFFIGLVEDYQRSFDILADLLDRPRIKLGHLNVSEKRSEIRLSDSVISEFRELNALDYKIYEYGRNHFEKQRWANAD